MAKRNRKPKAKPFWTNRIALLLVVGVIGLIVLGFIVRDTEAVQISHLHGLSFSADGTQLIVPAHIGFAVYENGSWSFPDIPAHDYMGYSGVDNGFFSSGHPNLRSDLANPLGLVKSTDEGETVVVIDFMGETDFHIMAVGYRNHAIYVLNPRPNSKLVDGIHYTLDEGQSWQQSQLQDLDGNLTQLAVHPVNANQVAIATERGLFLSDDYGDTLTKISDDGSVTAVSFHPTEVEPLYFGTTALYRYDLTNQQVETLSIPQLPSGDFIAYITASPVDGRIAFATFGKHIFLSTKNGQDWQQIAREGRGLNS